MTDLQSLKSAAKAATQGPLKLNRYDHGGGRLFREEPRQLVMDTYEEGDREFYALASPSVILALIERVERMEELLRAVWVSDHAGIQCNDPKGVNWFDARKKLLSNTALSGEGQ